MSFNEILNQDIVKEEDLHMDEVSFYDIAIAAKEAVKGEWMLNNPQGSPYFNLRTVQKNEIV